MRCAELGGKPVERRDRARLVGIGLELAGRDQRGIGRADRPGHAGASAGSRFSVPVKLCVGSPSCSHMP